MAISGLNLEEREELNNLYSELKEVTNQKKSLDSITRPLYEELSSLEEIEKKYDSEYEKLNGSVDLVDIEKLSSIAENMVEIANKKASIKAKLDEKEPEFKSINQKIEDCNRKIHFITNYEDNSVLGEGVTYLNRKGEVVNSIEEVNIMVSYSMLPEIIKNGIFPNKDKNQIIQAKNNVVNFINGVYQKHDGFKTKISNAKEHVIEFLNSVMDSYNKHYTEKEKSVNEIIEAYEREKQGEIQVEKEADNMQFFLSTQKENINSAMYMDSIDNKSDVLDNNSLEVNSSLEVESKTIPVESKRVDTKGIIEDDNLFRNIDKYDEELQRMKKEEEFKNVYQRTSRFKNKIANAIKDKVPGMIRRFKTNSDIIKKQKIEDKIKKLQEERSILEKGFDNNVDKNLNVA